LPCVALPIEKFTCLPEPLMPAKGFSCSRHSMPCFSATRRRVTMRSCWWSVGQVGLLEHRSDLELAGGDLVVAGLGRDAELEELALDIDHERQHSLGDGAEVVVVELLALRRWRAEQGAAGAHQVGAGEVEVAVDQEVLLLGPA
jgi:hypothetical protein